MKDKSLRENLSFETIVSTVKNSDIKTHILKMNIETDTVVVNQFDHFKEDSFSINNHKVTSLTVNERGVGLSRNTGFMRSKADICIIADDDLVYRDGYIKEIKKAYSLYPDADIICFNLKIIEKNGVKVKKLRTGKLRRAESLKIGTPMITFRRKSILKSLLSFSLLFGGGAVFGSGEDTLFIQEAFRKKLKIYQYDFIIADVYNDDSSWFEGYNEKFFFDRGALYRAAFPTMSHLMMLQFLVRKRKLFKDWKFLDAYREMQKGAKSFSNTDF
ncbi:glycosyltransferase family A protein [Streptococcus pluranimalium]